MLPRLDLLVDRGMVPVKFPRDCITIRRPVIVRPTVRMSKMTYADKVSGALAGRARRYPNCYS